MHSTPSLGLPKILAESAGKEEKITTALMRLDALVQPSALSRTVTSPPGSPAEGDRYIVPTGATGAWAGWDDSIAAYQGGWKRLEPRIGWFCWVDADAELCVYRGGTGWQAVSADAALSVANAALAAAESADSLAGAAMDQALAADERAFSADIFAGFAHALADSAYRLAETKLASDFSALPAASSVSGTDLIAVDQGDTTRRTPLSSLSAILSGGSGGSSTLAGLTDVVGAGAATTGQALIKLSSGDFGFASVSGGGGGGGGGGSGMTIVPASALPSTILLNQTTGAGWSVADGPEGPIFTSGAEYGQVLRGCMAPITGPFTLTVCVRRPLQRRQFLGYGPILYSDVSGEVQQLGWLQQASFGVPAMLRAEEWVWGSSGTISAVLTTYEMNLFADTLWMRLVWDGTQLEWWLSSDGVEGAGWNLVRRGSPYFSFPPSHFGWGWLSDIQFGMSFSQHKHTLRSWEIT